MPDGGDWDSGGSVLNSVPGGHSNSNSPWLVVVLLYMSAIFALSSVPGNPEPDAPGVYLVFAWLPPDLQNLLHIPLFSVLAWLWCRTLEGRRWSTAKVASLAFLLSLLYGLADEFHQSFVPGRMANVADMLLNGAGAILGVIAYLRFQGRDRTRRADTA